MSPGEQNMKTGPDALGIAKNESGRAKLKNGTRRTWNRRKRVKEQKNKKTRPGALRTAKNESESMFKSIRMLLAIVVFHDYEIWQMDIKIAF
jgi:hypothetical protein